MRWSSYLCQCVLMSEHSCRVCMCPVTLVRAGFAVNTSQVLPQVCWQLSPWEDEGWGAWARHKTGLPLCSVAITTPVGPEVRSLRCQRRSPWFRTRLIQLHCVVLLFLQHLCPRAVLEQEGLVWVFSGGWQCTGCGGLAAVRDPFCNYTSQQQ